jgi:hypothetical protein
VSDDVERVFPPDVDEAWERLTDDPELRGVGTARIDETGGWQVTVWVMEFVRQDPWRQRYAGGSALHCGRSRVSSRPMRKTVRSGS